MFDYNIFYKEELRDLSKLRSFLTGDRLISAYNGSERVQTTFDVFPSNKKDWLIFPEYEYESIDYPKIGSCYVCKGEDESSQIGGFFVEKEIDFEKEVIVIDITGFLRPQLAYLLNFLHKKKVHKIQLLYSEPEHYIKKENTPFTGGYVKEIRQIQGFEGVHTPDEKDDLLILGSGYDQNSIKSICNHKENSRKVQVLGFPSLRPDMYQENILRTVLASQELSEEALKKPIFAPANDPFVTASVLSEYVEKQKSSIGISNLYLSPLGTKAQVVGFVIFYLKELRNTSASLIHPFFSTYARETSKGINRIWKYTVEF